MSKKFVMLCKIRQECKEERILIMKKKLNFFDKLRMCMWVFKSPIYRFGTVTVCPNCKRIVIDTSKTGEKDGVRKKYTKYRYKCRSCGAVGKSREVWKI